MYFLIHLFIYLFIYVYSVAVITEGKYALLSEEGLDKLVSLLADATPAVRLNAVKVILK